MALRKIILIILFFAFLLMFYSVDAKVYYTSPQGTETILNKVTRDNPAEWRWITQGEGARELECGDSVLLRWDRGIYTEGTRIYATGCGDSYKQAIHYLSEPGGFAVFKTNNYDLGEPYESYHHRHYERKINPANVIIGGEFKWKSDGRDPYTDYNSVSAEDSELGRYVWVREIIVQGNYGDILPRRDFGSMTIPYGSTGQRAEGTIAGSKNYDDLTGGISIQAYGSRVINCIFWNLGNSGIGVNAAMREGDAVFYGNIVTNTGHSASDRDHFHSVYQQWHEKNKGRLIHKHGIYQFSAEEQLQIWAQSGLDSDGMTKVDHVDLIENVLINGGTLSGKKHPNRTGPNSKIAGYTYDTDIRMIGNISWHGLGNYSWQSGYSLNGNNDRRNFYFKDNYLVGSGAKFMNITSIKESSGNTFVRLGSRQLNYEIQRDAEQRMLITASNWDNNKYYGGGDFTYYKWHWADNSNSTENLDFQGWKKKGFDRSSTYTNGLPKDEIKYFRNEYLDYYPTNWQGHVVIFNWSGKDEVQINLEEFELNQGDVFRVIDVQNIGGNGPENYVYEGKYTEGMTVVIPVKQTDVVQDPTGEMLGPFHTDKTFFVGLIVRMTKSGQKPVDPDPIEPWNGKIDGAVLDPQSNCVTVSTEGDVDRVIITPIGGSGSHIENNEPWTICPWDMEKIGMDPEGQVTFNIIAYGPNGESVQDQITIDYGEEGTDPIDPDPIPDDYVTKEYFDQVIEQLRADHLIRYNMLIDEINKLMSEILNNRNDINRERVTK